MVVGQWMALHGCRSVGGLAWLESVLLVTLSALTLLVSDGKGIK